MEAIKAGLLEKAAEKGLEFRIKTVDAPIVEISSSEIRQAISEGRKTDIEQYLM